MNIKLKMYIGWMLGSLLLAIGSLLFLQPVGLVTGGFTGLGIVVYEVTNEYLGYGVPLWATNIILNIPLLIASYRIKGKDIIINTAIVVGMVTLSFYVVEFFTLQPMDMFMSAVAGGIIVGAGIGLILKNGATSGGTDLVAVLLHNIIKNVSLSSFMFYANATIVFMGLVVFGLEACLYAILSTFITSKIVDLFITGVNSGKGSIIISDEYEAIVNEIYKQLNRGATVFEGSSVYTKQCKKTIYCVVDKKEVAILRHIVNSIDANAFMTLSDVNEVVGHFEINR